jgi:hypothetical protein
MALVASFLSLYPRVSAAQDVPVISGGLGFTGTENAGAPSYQWIAAPQFTSPLGKYLLVESRFTFDESVSRKSGTSGPWEGTFFKTIPYLQLDAIASRHITLVVGRYLTPFGTYNERLTPIWIQDLQGAPRIYSVGDPYGSSDGGMVRGVIVSKPKVQVNYLGYYSFPVSNSYFISAREAGDRIDVYFPGKRLEIGTSYARLLQGTHTNAVGTHVWWEPWRFPLQVRSEYAHAAHAQGYWIESTYRLSQWKGPDSPLGRLEPVFRMQQTFRESPGPGDGLPAASLQQADFGLVYHLPHETRLMSSYSRKFTSTGNGNIWNFGINYRFLFPAWRGRK